MRIPLAWLGEHVSLAGIRVDELAARLTNAGIEVEAVEALGAAHPGVKVGVVSSVEAGKAGLRWLGVDVGEAEPVTLCSRAPNIEAVGAGARLAVALPGVPLFAPGQKPGQLALVEVRALETHGRMSQAVGCSALELGLSEDHSGVLVLGDQLAAGEALGAVSDAAAKEQPLSGAERVLTIAILPNIARCQSVRGVAKEVSALYGARLLPEPPAPELDVACSGQVDPSSEDPGICDGFATALLEGVRVAPSPSWLQRRLLAAGMQPVNNVVDASNYVMLERGQPTHAYDPDRLSSLRLSVRRARAGELFKALVAGAEEPPKPLPEGVPVIICDDVPVGIAGVMGGYESQVTDTTCRLLLEAAHFDPIAIRRAQAVTQTFSEASARFSRGADPAGLVPALRRIVELLRLSCPALRLLDRGLWQAAVPTAREIVFDIAEANATLGTNLPSERVIELLGRVELEVTPLEGTRLSVRVPTSRGDLALRCDLMEEVARLHGYDSLPATMPVEPVPGRTQPPEVAGGWALLDALAAAGLQQTISYTLSSREREQRLQAGRPRFEEPAYTEIINPLSEDRHVVRRSILANLIEAVHHNRRHEPSLALFELGVVAVPGSSRDGLPDEYQRLGIALCGHSVRASLHQLHPRPFDFYDLSGVLQALAARFHLGQVQLAAADQAPFHPGSCARAEVDGELLGYLGELHPAVATAFDLEGLRVYCADLDASYLIQKATASFVAPEPPRFPSIELDISVVVERDVPAAELLAATRQAAGDMLQNLTVCDVYEGPPIPEQRKNVGLRLTLGAQDRTLRMEEAKALRAQVVETLAARYGAVLRD